ncbi:MAG: hypothetical protein LBV33_01125 [Lachnospiraceae bacterium]|jgi:hypothetical protein|nr:hypothetical protein [Lachnospiraceae bacterium]
MLGKLIKHEWKAIWKFLLAMIIFNLAITLVGVLGLLFSPDMTASDPPPIYIIFIIAYVSTYFLGMAAVFFGSLIYLGSRFYRSMYGAEGYLTHTLPATPLQLITAKTIVATLMLIINGLLLCLSGCALAVSLAASLGETIPWNAMMVALTDPSFTGGTPIIVYIILYLVMLLIGLITSILMIYASASLGQLFNKHRVLGSVGIYFGLSMAMQITMTVLMIASVSIMVNLDGYNQSSDNFLSTFIQSTIATALYGFVFFIITYAITKKKLNLE